MFSLWMDAQSKRIPFQKEKNKMRAAEKWEFIEDVWVEPVGGTLVYGSEERKSKSEIERIALHLSPNMAMVALEQLLRFSSVSSMILIEDESSFLPEEDQDKNIFGPWFL